MIKVCRAAGLWSRPRREGRELTELFSNSDITRPSHLRCYILWWDEQIWSVKKTEEAAAKKRPKMSAAQLRVQKDLTELELPNTMTTHFPDPTDVLNFKLTITPDEGIYKGGVFNFSFVINPNYPHEPPKVRCLEKIYHPNLDLEGNVCLNILREDWKPVLNLSSVMIGLQYLFLEPNPDDPLNKEAAEDLRRNREAFVQNVKQSMRGGHVKGTTFDRVLK
ncbi:ubiquitin-conjugating enzyme/RWD-like protein [Dioszegia hungarica]|uniref:NEDD8-conjugating enzyme UBC12 n=1 Tax=Dioszegia hungarica TaxID=4972 RepID=A0AA38LVB1_9TREE|nr:ubiquitin-conjugating enzyme/RWD-like protein [Dioszegia hungarica]KAI9636358.1 ubiquitin-conjugating enzyme/RWD-like protein [Dioszegia hungarica]